MSHTIVESVQTSIKIAVFTVAAFAVTAVSAQAMTPAEQMQHMQSQLRVASEKLATMRPAGSVLGATSTAGAVVPVRPVCRLTLDKKSYKLNDTISVSWKTTGTKSVEFVEEENNSARDILTLPSATLTTNGSAKVKASVLGLPTITLKATSQTGHSVTCTKVVPIVDSAATAKDSRVAALQAQLLKMGLTQSKLVEQQEVIEGKINQLMIDALMLQIKIQQILDNPVATSSVKASVSIPAESVETSTESSGENDNIGTFTISYEVTAVDADIYMLTTATKSGKAGANYRLTGGASSTVAGTQSATLTSTAEKDGSMYMIEEGETETFTLTVSFDPTTTGEYRLELVNAQWATAAGATTFKKTSLNNADFRTSYETIQGS